MKLNCSASLSDNIGAKQLFTNSVGLGLPIFGNLLSYNNETINILLQTFERSLISCVRKLKIDEFETAFLSFLKFVVKTRSRNGFCLEI